MVAGGLIQEELAWQRDERRQARLIELDPKYCDVIILRWQEFGGGTAILGADGRSYEDIAVERVAAAA